MNTKVHSTIDDIRPLKAELKVKKDGDGCVPLGLVGLAGCLGLLVGVVVVVALLVKLFIWIVY